MHEPGAILLTGGTSGLGLEAATRLGAAGQHVIATGRDVASGPPLPGVRWAPLDLADRASIDALAADAPPLRALVANAGSQFTALRTTADGWEATFAVNHLGHVQLICALLSAGKLAGGARIVIVSSGTHDPALRTGMPAPRLTTAAAAAHDVTEDGGARAGRRRYTTSKLANVMTALHLARALQGRDITVTAYDPGLMPDTGLVRDRPRVVQVLYRGIASRALRFVPGVSTTAASGQVLADLAVADRWAGVTGAYVAIDRERPPSVQARDTAGQDRLWAESLALLGIAEDPAGLG